MSLSPKGEQVALKLKCDFGKQANATPFTEGLNEQPLATSNTESDWAREAMPLSCNAPNNEACNRSPEWPILKTHHSPESLKPPARGEIASQVSKDDPGLSSAVHLPSEPELISPSPQSASPVSQPRSPILSPGVARPRSTSSSSHLPSQAPPTRDYEINAGNLQSHKRAASSHIRTPPEPHNLPGQATIRDVNQSNTQSVQIATTNQVSENTSPVLVQQENPASRLFNSFHGTLPSPPYQAPDGRPNHPAPSYGLLGPQPNGQARRYSADSLPQQRGDGGLNVALIPPPIPVTIKGAFNKNQSRSKEARAKSRFETTARVLMRQKPRPQKYKTVVDPDILLNLPIGVLTSRELAPFFEWYCFKANATNIATLRFELLDVSWQLQNIAFLSKSDHVGYASLKSHISTLFYAALDRNPNMAEFRVSVSAENDIASVHPQALLSRPAGRTHRSLGPIEPVKQKGPLPSDKRQRYPLDVISPVAETEARPPPIPYPNPKEWERTSPIATLSGAGQPTAMNPNVPTRRDSQSHTPALNSVNTGAKNHHTSSGMPPPTPISPEKQSPQTTNHHGLQLLRRPPENTAPEIIILLQQSDGRLSEPYSKDVIHPRISSVEFFSWFGTQSGFGTNCLPPELQFTFKDALPAPKSSLVARGNEDHFNYMRSDIKSKCEKAKWFRPTMTEFAVLVTLPGWETEGAEVDW